MLRKLSLVWTLLVLVALVLSCQAAPTATPTKAPVAAPTTPAAPAAAATPTKAAAAPAAPAATKGGTLNVAFSIQPLSLDPATGRMGTDHNVLFTVYDAGYAFKATLPRRIPSGDLGDTDVYGAQQHAPLIDVMIPTG